MNRVLRHIRRAAFLDTRSGATDGQLLESFWTRHDEAAFEALLRRHGPMVLAVCRRVLRHTEDAEDAFQATFLVLVRRAASLRSPELLGNWLYGVAHRTALSARAMTAKRRTKERRAGEMARPEAPADGTSDDLLAQLDTALAGLPEKYRVPIVLCELEGRSRKEVARTLGLPEGTLSWRLAHAKKLLARRLSPCGAGVLTLALSRKTAAACVSARLLRETAHAALRVVAGESLTAGAVSAQVLTLTEGVLKAMLLSKIKGFAAVAFVLLVGVGVVGLTYRPAAAQAEKLRPAPQAGRDTPDELEELRLEVAALRKGLEVTRARVKALEGQVQTLQASNARRDSDAVMADYLNQLKSRTVFQTTPLAENHYRVKTKKPDDPLADAEAALKKLRQHPDDQQAADTLERAVQQLRKREKPASPPQKK